MKVVVKKGILFKKIVQWASFAIFLGCSATILIESGIDGENSGAQSGGVTDQVQDFIDKNHDKETVKEIQDFSVSFVSPAENNTYFVGDILQYSLGFIPEDTSYKTLNWSVSDSSILNVSESENQIVFLKQGSADVEIKSDHNPALKKTFSFIVKNIPVSSIRLKEERATLNIGEAWQINATVLPNNATNQNLIFSSRNPEIASVQEKSGYVKALSAGETDIDIVSEDQTNIKTSFHVSVNKPEETVYELTDISLQQGNYFLNSKQPSITLKGTYKNAAAKFDANNLQINIKNNDSYVTISNKVGARGSFSFRLTLKNNVAENNNIDSYPLEVGVSYNDVSSKENVSVSIEKLKTISLKDINQTSLKKEITSYFTNFETRAETKTAIKDTTTFNVPFISSFKQIHYNTTNFLWKITKKDGSEYPITTYFNQTSSLSKSVSYSSLKLIPVSSLPEEGVVTYYPNKTNLDEYISFSFKYDILLDTSWKITDISFNKLYEDKDNVFYIGEEYNNNLLTSKIAATSKVSAVKSSLEKSELQMKIADTSIAEFIDDPTGSHIGLTFKKVGKTTLTLSSEIGGVEKTYSIVGTNKPNENKLYINELEFHSSLDNTIRIDKDQVYTFDVRSSFNASFKDGTKLVTENIPTSFSWEFSGKRNNLIILNDTHSIQGLKQDTENEYISLKITVSFNGSVLETMNYKIVVSYIPVKLNAMSIEFSLISLPNEYNKVSSEWKKIPVGSTFRVIGKVNSDATNKQVSYASSNENILSINPDSGVAIANDTGKVTITITSADDVSKTKSVEITITNTSSPFSFDFEKMKPLSYETVKENGNEYDSIKLDYGVAYQIHIKTEVASTSSVLSFKHHNEKGVKNAVSIDKAGRIRTRTIGKDIVEVIYGDPNSGNTYSRYLHIEVTRNARFTYNELQLLVRKSLGHFGLFALTAAFASIFIWLTFEKDIHKFIALAVSMVIGFALAGFSELIQVYTPGRFGAWKDVGIDTAGYALTVLLTVIVVAIIKLIKYLIKKKKKD